MTTIAPTKPVLLTFPTADVESCLLAELIEVATAEAQVRGIELPKDPALMVKMSIRMDSLSVVDTLCAVEPAMGFELKDSLVRTGGYASVQAAFEHLMPKLEKAWKQKHGVKT
jgi:hypothetical protein